MAAQKLMKWAVYILLIIWGIQNAHAQNSVQLNAKILETLSQTSSAFEADVWVTQWYGNWFGPHFNFVAFKSELPKLLATLKGKHQSLYLKVQAHWKALQDLNPSNYEPLYELLRGHLMVMSDKIKKHAPITESEKFRTYVLSYILDNTPATTASDEWPLWKSLARLLGQEADAIHEVEKWLHEHAPHPAAQRIFALFDFHFRHIHGWEGPSQKLRPEDQHRLDKLTQQVLGPST